VKWIAGFQIEDFGLKILKYLKSQISNLQLHKGRENEAIDIEIVRSGIRAGRDFIPGRVP
jgi:hypothetical protein